MEKLNMHSIDKVDENVQKIGNLFPNCVTETINDKGKLIKAIDFDMLKQELSKVVVDGPKERYQFTWPDKKKSMLLANSPISATLRPCKDESVNFDETENLYIEGDNLDVLKLLQETYLGKVKMIYIDPPYNTGNDFVYEDNFDIDAESYKEMSGDYDDQGNRLVKNNDSNGRFHTDWLNMMYPRLKLARDLLTDDGVIFISIDDNEVENLKKIANDVFGESNFVGNFIWKSKQGKVGTTSTISTTHEYILCFSKNLSQLKFKMIESSNEGRKENLRQWGQADRREDRPSMFYPIIIDGISILPIKEDGSEGRWRVGKDTSNELLQSGILSLENKNGNHNIYRIFPEGSSLIPYSTILSEKIGTTAQGSVSLKSLNMTKSFDYSKPVSLLNFFINLSTNKNDVIFDFFSGSATTAHAVMKLNAEDGGNRKFIMVQIPEITDEKSEAFKAGYKNICEIGKERIRRAGKKILADNADKPGIENLDIGFRVLKLDSSNMKDVYYTPEQYVTEPALFNKTQENIKEDRTDLDLLFQIMLELDVLLSSTIEETVIAGKKVYSVKDNYLIACFDKDITDEVVTQIAKKKPIYAVLRDSSFATDSVAANFEQIFATYSPETTKKIL